jgi:hypothetical protein
MALHPIIQGRNRKSDRAHIILFLRSEILKASWLPATGLAEGKRTIGFQGGDASSHSLGILRRDQTAGNYYDPDSAARHGSNDEE